MEFGLLLWNATLHFKESMTPQVSLYALVAIWLLSMALGFKPVTREADRLEGPLSLGMEADAPDSSATSARGAGSAEALSPGNPTP